MGFVDANTISKMSRLRCGVPDHFSLNKSHELHLHIPTFSSHYTFYPGHPKWPRTKRRLTYSFQPGTRTDVINPILHATQMWASVSHFTFTQARSHNRANIKISFQFGDHGDGFPFDGPGGTLAHAFPPSDGRLHFDGDETWVDGVLPGAIDMQTVGLHELGHILGLGHSPDYNSIMSPFFGSGQRKFLGQDDIDGIRALYQS
ncbi:UNVERIFIED_CONTAM: Metalloendoproteinase 1 [Sesamum latifolium]|uniref:Metalloendoproteinase 1 n=1 Tax=Sesamum latifolium TaxID=2727402 RepID=A0AAW2Y0S0_9LAMI